MTQQAAVEVNNFVGGLITEASPLNFPANASLDEVNFELNRDGTRNRRLGMNYEGGYETRTCEDGVSQVFLWTNVGQNPDRKMVAAQAGTYLLLYSVSSSTLSSGTRMGFSYAEDADDRFGFATIDGKLVVTSGRRNILVIDYDDTLGFSFEYGTLSIRDFFGVEANTTDEDYGDIDLRSSSYYTLRPNSSSTNRTHDYNLRNQTWALPRPDGGDENLKDPIISFLTADDNTDSLWPSNADAVNYSIFSNANDSDDRTLERFYANNLYKNPPGSVEAPRGYFVIDAMQRGVSRMEMLEALYTDYEDLVDVGSDLPDDTTSGGASVVASYAGRAWFAGFNGELIDGDSYSPYMGNYVLYSQIASTTEDLFRCYQEADPTSYVSSDLVDTDGGYLRIADAYNICYMVALQSSLLVFAENGVWAISGGSGYGFTATDYLVKRLSTEGTVNPGSIVLADGAVYYWGFGDIFRIAPGNTGDLQGQNLTSTTIQTFYKNIDTMDKKYCNGFYQSSDKKVKWVYGGRSDSSDGNKELTLDLDLQAFYTHEYGEVDDSTPKVLAGLEIPPTTLTSTTTDVYYDDDGTTESVYYYDEDAEEDEQVTYTYSSTSSTTYDSFYLTIIDQEGESPLCTFSKYRDTDWMDWSSYDGTGVDAAAYVITGWSGQGDNQRRKQLPYLTFYMEATETGYETDDNGDLALVNSSSCFVQTRWDWAGSSKANKWGSEKQMYRRNRHYMPEDVSEDFDDGYDLVVTKNRLRGRGRSLGLKMSSEEGYDCRIVGWSMVMGVNGNV